MATIQIRKGKDGKDCYRALVRLKGFPVESKTFDRKTDARDWARETEANIKAGRYMPTKEARRRTFGEMIDRYIKDVLPTKAQNSRHSQEPQLLWWKKQLGIYTLADITPPMIAEQKDALLKEITRFKKPMTSSTVVRYMAALSHCYTVAMKEWGWVDDTPMRKISKPKESRGRVRFLSDEEREALLSACRQSGNPYLYDIVVLALSTGMRKSELLGLTWDAVDFARKMITLEKTKNGDRRAVPLVGHALDRLRERARIRRIDSAYVFPGEYRAGGVPKHADIESAWRVALVKAGLRAPKEPKKVKKGKGGAVREVVPAPKTVSQEIQSQGEGFRFHDLRHSCASYLAMNGATLADIAEVLGHRTLQMVRRYAHLSEAHTSRVVDSMNAKIFGSGTAEGQEGVAF